MTIKDLCYECREYSDDCLLHPIYGGGKSNVCAECRGEQKKYDCFFCGMSYSPDEMTLHYDKVWHEVLICPSCQPTPRTITVKETTTVLDCLMFDIAPFLELMAYVRGVPTEIFGIGRIQRDQTDHMHVTDIRIIPQIVGGADANATAEDMEKFFMESGIPDEERPEWCFNWHSHVTMATSPSGTDLKNYTNLNDLFEVLVPFIFNQDAEYNGYVYHSHPVRGHHQVNRIWIYEWKKHYKKLGKKFDADNQIKFIEAMFHMQDIKMTEERALFVEQEILDKVKERPKPTVAPSYNGYGGGYQGGNYGHNQTGLAQTRSTVAAEQNRMKYGYGFDEDDFTDMDPDAAAAAEEFALRQGFTKAGTGAKDWNPHNWSLARIVEEMDDYDFDWDEKERKFTGRAEGKDVIWDIRQAKDFLASMMAAV